jgi:hypothetical protein
MIRGLEGRPDQPSATHPPATFTIGASIVIYASTPAAGRPTPGKIAMAVDARRGFSRASDNPTRVVRRI